jgi:hypothetical protein
MSSLTLNFKELERLLKVFAYASIALGAIIFACQVLFLNKSTSAAEIQSASVAVVINAALFGFLAKRPWLYPRLSRLLSRPIVHGLWWGTLYTDYRPQQGIQLGPIPIAFVVRQSYLGISIQSYTEKQPASSTLESLHLDEKTTDVKLRYVFEMVRLAYAENKITSGCGELTLEENGKTLAGHYWTNSPTQGRLALRLVRRDCDGINSFEAAKKICNRHPSLK